MPRPPGADDDDYLYLPDHLTDTGMDIDIPREISDQIPGPATPSTYDRRIAQDHTGLEFLSRARKGRPGLSDHERESHRKLENAGILNCPGCEGENFLIFCSIVPGEALTQIVCANRRCGVYWPALEFSPVQMNNRIARNHNLWVPPGTN